MDPNSHKMEVAAEFEPITEKRLQVKVYAVDPDTKAKRLHRVFVARNDAEMAQGVLHAAAEILALGQAD